MTWPDIISGKTFCHYAKIVPFVLRHEVLLLYITFVPISLLFYDYYYYILFSETMTFWKWFYKI